MAIASLNNEPIEISQGNDSIIIEKYLYGRPGGATLDTTGYGLSVIPAGLLVIRSTVDGSIKPMPLKNNNTEYDSLTGDHEYEGIVVATVRTSKPFVGIMWGGSVNDHSSVIPFEIPNAAKIALKNITFKTN